MVTNFRPDPAMLAKTETLIEALPYLQHYAGAVFVVKYGGHAMGDDDAANRFAEDVALLKAVGINPVVVHGGGPQIGAMLTRLGVKSEFIGGLRVTDRATAEVAEMVLAGTINGELVDRINAAGGRAMGLSGKDARFVVARKVTRSVSDPGSAIEREVDLGFVGEPALVDRSVLDTMIRAGVIPVIAPIAPGDDGQTYNINADTMAGAVAVALGAARFFLLTDVPGVLNRDGNLLTDLSKPEADALIADGTISGGMIPKVETCLSAVASGVGAAVVIDGRVPHGILLEVFTRQGAGTLFRP
ncbi:MAG: acetylglutamate kinase [Sphingomonadaceae bacterium]|nr:acetylglutamate kinase [Sphingomonadaceae bacterium]